MQDVAKKIKSSLILHKQGVCFEQITFTGFKLVRFIGDEPERKRVDFDSYVA